MITDALNVAAGFEPTSMATWVVSPYLQIVHLSDDELLVKHGGRSQLSEIIKDEERSGLLGKVVRKLRAPASVDALIATGLVDECRRAEVVALVDYLVRANVLIKPDAYLPHAYLSLRFGASADRVGRQRIGFVGSGPLGSRIAREIARLNPAEILLLDDRRATIADRAFFDFAPIAVELDATLAEITERVLIRDEGARGRVVPGPLDGKRALAQLFGASDLVVVALESTAPQVLHAVNQVALELGKPWLSVYFDGSEAFIGPLYHPGESPCYNEREIQHEATFGLRDDYYLYKDQQTVADLAARHFVLPPYLSVASGWAATAAIAFLTGGGSFVESQCVRVDFERLSVDYEHILKLPRCPACRDLRPAYRNTFL